MHIKVKELLNLKTIIVIKNNANQFIFWRLTYIKTLLKLYNLLEYNKSIPTDQKKRNSQMRVS